MSEEKIKCCSNCKHYDKRTHFCRFNPPSVMVFYEDNGSNNVSSKFPVITKPEMDYCSNFDKN